MVGRASSESTLGTSAEDDQVGKPTASAFSPPPSTPPRQSPTRVLCRTNQPRAFWGGRKGTCAAEMLSRSSSFRRRLGPKYMRVVQTAAERMDGGDLVTVAQPTFAPQVKGNKPSHRFNRPPPPRNAKRLGVRWLDTVLQPGPTNNNPVGLSEAQRSRPLSAGRKITPSGRLIGWRKRCQATVLQDAAATTNGPPYKAHPPH